MIAEEKPFDNAREGTGFKKIIIGICAMQRKANSKPMRSIMNKMVEFYKDYLNFEVFPEEVILTEPVEKWPLCDCLISFHSTDFPLRKAIEYERLRRPYVLNDLQRQFDLLDRRKVFRTLARAGIDHPRHCVLMRNDKGELIGDELREFSDHIEVNGMVFNKPFVEKPVNAEDHNIHIYFPSAVGGGSQRLFRKINDRSSWYSPVSTVRQEGSYIYEEFIPADGTDVKVYAVGPYYAHAEARKAPGLDGKVERDADGKEVRFPVILSAKEKTIARRVVLAFGQSVCGFDLLRANGRSYVCDVNGFSFVKTSTKYYEDTAKILGNTILRRLATTLSIPWHIPFQDDDPPLVSTPSGKIMELRCVLAIIRHGDRTPKQKMKVAVSDERFFKMFRKYDGIRKKEIKMKKPSQLMEVLEIVRQLLIENQAKRQNLLLSYENFDQKMKADCYNCDLKKLEIEMEKCEESIKTWEQMKYVLEMYGHFSGINRKVQLKYLKPKAEKAAADEAIPMRNQLHLETHSTLLDDFGKGNNSGSLLLILKWGGELTTAGVLQAEALGKLFRTLYPGIRRTDGKDSPEDTQGLGFLRLHSTFRHDLKIYSSDEGRVQMTAAAFAKGLLALEGELTPILMQMVKSANTDGLLNDDYSARLFQDDVKRYLHSALQEDRDFTQTDFQALNPSGLRSLGNAMEFIKNPRKMCHEIAGYVQKMCEIIRYHKMNNMNIGRTLYLNESWDLAERRWTKELREFRKPSKAADGYDFDISKIPDIYDNIKYDMEHNPELCINNEGEFERFYLCVKNMADIVVPQEYGISEESKICIAQRVCSPLLAKVRNDLHRCTQSGSDDGADESLTRLDPRASEGIATPMRHVRTRLYFTSESHLHTLMNLIRYGGLCSPDDKKWQRAMNFLSGVTEFNYMTQLVLMVYEDSRSDEEIAADNKDGNGRDKQGKDGKNRFHIEMLFSPGLYPCFQTEKERIYESRYSNRHKTSREGKISTKTKQNSGGGSNVHPYGKQYSSGAASGENQSDREMSEAIEVTALDIANSLLSAQHPSDIENGAQSDYSQASEVPTRKSSAVIQSLAKDLDQEGGSAEENCSFSNERRISREHKESAGSCTGELNQSDDDEDDLTEDNAVNLVVLDEVSSAGIGKTFCKGDLAKHNSTSDLSDILPMRKRHATFERNPENTPGHSSSEMEKSKVQTQFEEEESMDTKQRRKNSGKEFMNIVLKQGGTRSFEEGNDICPSLSIETEKKVKFPEGLFKSLSDISCNRTICHKSQDINMNIGHYHGTVEEGMEGLEIEENQATVGHGRGEWAKQLVEERKGKNKDLSVIQQQQLPEEKEMATKLKDNLNEQKAPFISSRIPLSSIFKQQSNFPYDLLAVVPETEKSKQLPETKDAMENDEFREKINTKPSSSTIKDEDAEENNRSSVRKPRFPYRFKHHTVNLLTAATQNKLISTDVLMGRFNDRTKRKGSSNSVVLATAVIGRSSSAPRLQTYNAGDELTVNEIRRFWPPLRSLETMHDNLNFKETDQFLERMMKNTTPLPSPPKTPVQYDNSLTNMQTEQKDVDARICRLPPQEH